ncbi:Sulfotransferase family protein [Desulfacinum hydrothermale DSM 13146]|uniref:Sulfotransferase family protein n=1 Tax=Desulfacinum hydrothermale DSM 13146 TaxID=1121390 RepID=A0A1W1XT50_9BACT|nr:sulfotransferase [Desulfacinum hydrothermale]SMC26708.1 Sulfotransferase family protein [Desulfacinum hydrothermale DSM 13146]
MKKPNFFIIGAPKCGTTSLYNWLRTHPQVFLSIPKEPHFFNTDVGFNFYTDLKAYEGLFFEANSQHLAVGEASTSYLWSGVAVPSILKYSPGARFIVMLRKPQEMAVSLYAQECGGAEDQPSFEAAWRLQTKRAQGYSLPAFCPAPDLYQYGDRCRIGSQLKRLFEHVSQDRVLVVFLENLRRDPRGEYDRVLQFLGLSRVYPAGFSAANTRRHIRSFRLKKVLNALGHLKSNLGIKKSTGLLAPFYRLNTAAKSKQMLPPPLRRELDAYFEPEIRIVRDLLGRVPSEWLD